MNWYKQTQLEETDQKVSPRWNYGKYFRMNIEDDSFIHFTTQKRANEIMQSGVIQLNPPYSGYVKAVFAVSVTYGVWFPSVQTTHIKSWMDVTGYDDTPLVAVHFMTDIKPIGSHKTEVVWHQDVPLLTADIISVSEAKDMIENNNQLSDDDEVHYNKDYDDYTEHVKKVNEEFYD